MIYQVKINSYAIEKFEFSIKKTLHTAYDSDKPSPRQLLRVLSLTQCSLVMPYGDRDLGQHWLR